MIETLRQRDFALLWTAGLISVLGNWALFAALAVFLYEETGSTFLAGVLWVVVFLPNVVVSPFAGVMVDRWDRRRVMLVSNVIQAVAMAPLALALVSGVGRGCWRWRRWRGWGGRRPATTSPYRRSTVRRCAS